MLVLPDCASFSKSALVKLHASEPNDVQKDTKPLADADGQPA